MKKIIPNIITVEEAKIIIDNGMSITNNSFHHPVISKIENIIESELGEIEWSKPTYKRVEGKPGTFRGLRHNWHVDTGSNGHMLWCDYGGSILLNDKDTSGFLEYRDGTKILPKEHYCSLAIHSSDVEHRVYDKGSRQTLLLFLQRKL